MKEPKRYRADPECSGECCGEVVEMPEIDVKWTDSGYVEYTEYVKLRDAQRDGAQMIPDIGEARPSWKFNCNHCDGYGRAYWPMGTVKPNACPICGSAMCGFERTISPEEVTDGLATILIEQFAQECKTKENGDLENELEFVARLLGQFKRLREAVESNMHMATTRMPSDVMPKEQHLESLMHYVEVELKKALEASK